MKPGNLRELLTAAIDGELTPAERKVAQRALRQSETARRLFTQLKADAARLKKLPRIPAPVDIVDNVMGVIRERAIAPTPLPPTPRRSRFDWTTLSVWVNVATAVAVLLVISFGSFMYFDASRQYQAKLDLVRNEAKQRNLLPDGPGSARPAPVEPGPQPKVITPDAGNVAKVPDSSPEIGPTPRVFVPNSITGPPKDPLPEIEPFDLNKIRVSHLFDMHDLTKDEQVRKKLVTEMKKDELIRLDLFCQSTPKALEFANSALRARGITVITDGFVQERLKKRLATELVIFTEAMSPDEVGQLLAALGSDDAKSGAGEFETVVAAPFLPGDLTRLGQLLGISNVLPKPAGKEKVDITKPLQAGTAKDLYDAMAKMGTGSSRPSKPEKVAVIVAYSPMNSHPTASKEIKQFLDRRGDRKSDGKPLMLVLRTTK
jgi:hypothetical protein